ncbi:MAG: ATP synthase F1 subunit delta [Planctomycetota bacterium]
MSGAAVRRYAEALYELAVEKGVLEGVATGMARVRENLAADRSLATGLASVRATGAEKHALVEGKIAAGAHPFVVNAIKLLVDRHRERDLVFFLLGFFEHMEAEQGILSARVESARPMGDEEVRNLAARLSDATGKRVVLANETVEELVGGVRLTLGSTRIDASVKRQLDNIEARLKSAI